MGIILFLILVLTAGYLTTHFLMDRLKSRYLLAGGLEYMLLGVMMGPVAAGWYNSVYGWFGQAPEKPVQLVTDSVLQSLSPVIALGIGSIGLLAGLRMNFVNRKVPFESQHVLASLVISITTGLTLGIPALLGLMWYVKGPPAFAVHVSFWDSPLEALSDLAASFFSYPIGDVLPLVLFVVAMGIVSATRPIAYTIDRYKATGPLSRFTVNAAELSGLWGLLVLGLMLSISRPVQSEVWRELTWVEWLVVQIVIGVLFGVLFRFLITHEDKGEKLLVTLLGITVCATVVAYFLKLSPLFINFFLGLTLANTSQFHERLLTQLSRVEKPLCFVLYFFAGMAWRPTGLWWVVIALVAGYFALRWFGRRAGSEASFRMSDTNQQIVGMRSLGKGLMAQGGLAVAMVLNFQQVSPSTPRAGTWVYAHATAENHEAVHAILEQGIAFASHDLASLISTIVLANILISELLAFRMTRNLLIDANEIEPSVKLAPEDMYAHDPSH